MLLVGAGRSFGACLGPKNVANTKLKTRTAHLLPTGDRRPVTAMVTALHTGSGTIEDESTFNINIGLMKNEAGFV